MDKKLSPTNKTVKNMEVDTNIKKTKSAVFKPNDNNKKDVSANQEYEVNND